MKGPLAAVPLLYWGALFRTQTSLSSGVTPPTLTPGCLWDEDQRGRAVWLLLSRVGRRNRLWFRDNYNLQKQDYVLVMLKQVSGSRNHALTPVWVTSPTALDLPNLKRRNAALVSNLCVFICVFTDWSNKCITATAVSKLPTTSKKNIKEPAEHYQRRHSGR